MLLSVMVSVVYHPGLRRHEMECYVTIPETQSLKLYRKYHYFNVFARYMQMFVQ